MTLSTHIAFGAPVDPEELFAFCRGLLFGSDDSEEPRDPDTVPIVRDSSTIHHRPGMGLPAWLFVHHNNGKPLPLSDDDDDEMVEYYKKNPTHNGWAYAYVDFDTAYGYQNRLEGYGCTELHARYIAALFAWAGTRETPVPMKWRNEYSGEWFDNLDGLRDFIGHGETATNWFRDIVKPVIEAQAAEKGATTQWG